jgi:hypothetical protein
MRGPTCIFWANLTASSLQAFGCEGLLPGWMTRDGPGHYLYTSQVRATIILIIVSL